MAGLLDVLAPLAIVLVAIVLLAGLWNMMRGGSGNRTQQFMRARVILQFAAIVIMMGALWLAGR